MLGTGAGPGRVAQSPEQGGSKCLFYERRRQGAVWWCRGSAPSTGWLLGMCKRRRLAPRPGGADWCRYGRPESACDTSRLTPERRRATGSPPGLDCPLHHPSGRDPTIPRTAGRTMNGRSSDESGGGRDPSTPCGGCTSSFTRIAWGPTPAIGTPRPGPPSARRPPSGATPTSKWAKAISSMSRTGAC